MYNIGVIPPPPPPTARHRPTLTTHTPGTTHLQPGWTNHKDPSSGETYYVNQETGTTQWEKPTTSPTSLSNNPMKGMGDSKKF